MPTRLSRYAEGVMEAAWIAAVIVTPLFFNIYSSRIFEPDKISLLRTLALLTLVAWIVLLIEQGGFPAGEGDEPRWKTFLKIPIVLPVLILAGVYLVSTIFSIVPGISLLGSYQRLQGTYTTFSYLVIFASLAINLRRRPQVERLITTIILVSLPVSFYGYLQHAELDPVPWAGNVTRRIAANMGNAIFVAAYLIMVVPLTIGRLIQAYREILDERREHILAPFIRATGYFIILLFQLTAIYFSRSRGPFLGLLAGGFFLFVVISLQRQRRWLTLSILAVSGLLAVFLILLNVENGPLEALRETPWVGRFGHVFDAEQGTNRVRQLIWEGDVKLVSPHTPLEYPDGSADSFNILRPLIGYGPESMHVAYNRFYPPELGRVESRNASPDRSHNETWDTLVTTGLFGLIAYLVLFSTVFYYGLKWLGLISSTRDRNLYLGLFFGGSLASAAAFILILGAEFLGVGLPFGAILGMILYLALRAVIAPIEPPSSDGEIIRGLTLLMLLAGLVGHFVEINFGIAIVATRTYFWIYTGMILCVGYFMTKLEEYPAADPVVENAKTEDHPARGRKRSRHTQARSSYSRTPVRNFLANGAILGLILGTLGYDYINAQNEINNAFSMIWDSFTRLPNKGGVFSIGLLGLILLTGLISALILGAESSTETRTLDWKGFGIILAVGFGLALVFWIWHANGLISLAINAGNNADILTQAGLFERLLTRYYVFLFLIVLLAARFLSEDWPRKTSTHAIAGWFAASLALLVAVALGVFSNLHVIQADITFKLYDPFTRNGQYDQALALLKRASDLSYGVDHYSLFLGKTYLESAGLAQNAEEQNQRVDQALESLLQAQNANPLNTDHTANLARLYRWWAGQTDDLALRKERGETSAHYYERALILSPNNAALWGEWGSLYLTVLNDYESAYEKLSTGLEVDPFFYGIQALLGDYFTNYSHTLEDPQAKLDALQQAADHYSGAISLLKPNAAGSREPRYNYTLALGIVYSEMGERQKAIQTYQAALQGAPQNAETWRVYERISVLQAELGDLQSAISSANQALSLAPAGQKDRLQQYLQGLQGTS
jgi:tetratricopeptide (TPR) repeat protein